MDTPDWITLALRGEVGPVAAAVMITEAVEDPTAEQRRNLPDAAFALVLSDPRRRVMPHHINTVRDPDDNGTVDLPRLRNALARMNQVRGLSPAQMRRVRAHISRHADELLGDEENEGRKAAGMSVDELLVALRKAA